MKKILLGISIFLILSIVSIFIIKYFFAVNNRIAKLEVKNIEINEGEDIDLKKLELTFLNSKNKKVNIEYDYKKIKIKNYEKFPNFNDDITSITEEVVVSFDSYQTKIKVKVNPRKIFKIVPKFNKNNYIAGDKFEFNNSKIILHYENSDITREINLKLDHIELTSDFKVENSNLYIINSGKIPIGINYRNKTYRGHNIIVQRQTLDEEKNKPKIIENNFNLELLNGLENIPNIPRINHIKLEKAVENQEFLIVENIYSEEELNFILKNLNYENKVLFDNLKPNTEYILFYKNESTNIYNKNSGKIIFKTKKLQISDLNLNLETSDNKVSFNKIPSYLLPTIENDIDKIVYFENEKNVFKNLVPNSDYNIIFNFKNINKDLFDEKNVSFKTKKLEKNPYENINKIFYLNKEEINPNLIFNHDYSYLNNKDNGLIEIFYNENTNKPNTIGIYDLYVKLPKYSDEKFLLGQIEIKKPIVLELEFFSKEKTYGEKDPLLSDVIKSNTTNDYLDLLNVTRDSGEDIGVYQYSVSLKDNIKYDLVLKNSLPTLKINKYLINIVYTISDKFIVSGSYTNHLGKIVDIELEGNNSKGNYRKGDYVAKVIFDGINKNYEIKNPTFKYTVKEQLKLENSYRYNYIYNANIYNFKEIIKDKINIKDIDVQVNSGEFSVKNTGIYKLNITVEGKYYMPKVIDYVFEIQKYDLELIWKTNQNKPAYTIKTNLLEDESLLNLQKNNFNDDLLKTPNKYTATLSTTNNNYNIINFTYEYEVINNISSFIPKKLLNYTFIFDNTDKYLEVESNLQNEIKKILGSNVTLSKHVGKVVNFGNYEIKLSINKEGFNNNYLDLNIIINKLNLNVKVSHDSEFNLVYNLAEELPEGIILKDIILISDKNPSAYGNHIVEFSSKNDNINLIFDKNPFNYFSTKTGQEVVLDNISYVYDGISKNDQIKNYVLNKILTHIPNTKLEDINLNITEDIIIPDTYSIIVDYKNIYKFNVDITKKEVTINQIINQNYFDNKDYIKEIFNLEGFLSLSLPTYIIKKDNNIVNEILELGNYEITVVINDDLYTTKSNLVYNFLIKPKENINLNVRKLSKVYGDKEPNFIDFLEQDSKKYLELISYSRVDNENVGIYDYYIELKNKVRYSLNITGNAQIEITKFPVTVNYVISGDYIVTATATNHLGENLEINITNNNQNGDYPAGKYIAKVTCDDNNFEILNPEKEYKVVRDLNLNDSYLLEKTFNNQAYDLLDLVNKTLNVSGLKIQIQESLNEVKNVGKYDFNVEVSHDVYNPKTIQFTLSIKKYDIELDWKIDKNKPSFSFKTILLEDESVLNLQKINFNDDLLKTPNSYIAQVTINNDNYNITNSTYEYNVINNISSFIPNEYLIYNYIYDNVDKYSVIKLDLENKVKNILGNDVTLISEVKEIKDANNYLLIFDINKNGFIDNKLNINIIINKFDVTVTLSLIDKEVHYEFNAITPTDEESFNFTVRDDNTPNSIGLHNLTVSYNNPNYNVTFINNNLSYIITEEIYEFIFEKITYEYEENIDRFIEVKQKIKNIILEKHPYLQDENIIFTIKEKETTLDLVGIYNIDIGIKYPYLTPSEGKVFTLVVEKKPKESNVTQKTLNKIFDNNPENILNIINLDEYENEYGLTILLDNDTVNEIVKPGNYTINVKLSRKYGYKEYSFNYLIKKINFEISGTSYIDYKDSEFNGKNFEVKLSSEDVDISKLEYKFNYTLTDTIEKQSIKENIYTVSIKSIAFEGVIIDYPFYNVENINLSFKEIDTSKLSLVPYESTVTYTDPKAYLENPIRGYGYREGSFVSINKDNKDINFEITNNNYYKFGNKNEFPIFINIDKTLLIENKVKIQNLVYQENINQEVNGFNATFFKGDISQLGTRNIIYVEYGKELIIGKFNFEIVADFTNIYEMDAGTNKILTNDSYMPIENKDIKEITVSGTFYGNNYQVLYKQPNINRYNKQNAINISANSTIDNVRIIGLLNTSYATNFGGGKPLILMQNNSKLINSFVAFGRETIETSATQEITIKNTYITGGAMGFRRRTGGKTNIINSKVFQPNYSDGYARIPIVFLNNSGTSLSALPINNIELNMQNSYVYAYKTSTEWDNPITALGITLSFADKVLSKPNAKQFLITKNGNEYFNLGVTFITDKTKIDVMLKERNPIINSKLFNEYVHHNEPGKNYVFFKKPEANGYVYSYKNDNPIIEQEKLYIYPTYSDFKGGYNA